MASHTKRPLKPLSILMVEPHGWRGLAHYTYNLCQALSDLGVDVTLLTPFNYELIDLPRKFTLRRVLSGYKKNSYKESLLQIAVRKLKGLFKHPYNLVVVTLFALIPPKADAVHYQSRLGRLGLLNIGLVSAIRKCVIYTAHEILPFGQDTKKIRAYYRNIYRKARRIIVHSEDSKCRLLELTEVKPSKVDVIRHGTYSFFALDESLKKSRAKAAMGLPQSAKIVLFFGTLSPYKGVKYLIRVFKEIPTHINEAKLLIAGHGATEAEEATYLSLIRQTGISDNVIFFNRYADVVEVQKFFTVADVVVLPYVEAYTSGVLQIAYAFGKPVITTDVGELQEVVEDGQTGLVVPARDERALRNAIVNILNDDKKRAEMGKRAKELSMTAFSWETVAMKTITAYQKLHDMGKNRFVK
jgi:glycosyltransferase involved in cell wall biosynthesis